MASSCQSDNYRIKPGRDGKCGLATILDLTGIYVPMSCSEENIKNLKSYFQLINVRTAVVRDIRTSGKLHSALTRIVNSITEADSLCFVVLIAKGSDRITRMPNGEHLRDEDVEAFFDENNCVLLRGKPKLFLYHKYFTIPDTVTTVDFQPLTSYSAGDVILDEPNSSTHLNMWSYNIYDLGIESLLTETLGSVVLQYLPQHYRDYGTDYDLVDFFKRFLGEMRSLLNMQKSCKSVCSMMVNRLGKKLVFLQPQGERHEEQDTECYLSDSISQVSIAHSASPLKSKADISQSKSCRGTCKYNPYTRQPNRAGVMSDIGNSDNLTRTFKHSVQERHYITTEPKSGMYLPSRVYPHSQSSVETDHIHFLLNLSQI